MRVNVMKLLPDPQIRDMPVELPIIPVRDSVSFPNDFITLVLEKTFDLGYLNIGTESTNKNACFVGLVLLKPGRSARIEARDFYRAGVSAYVRKITKSKSGGHEITMQTLHRFRVDSGGFRIDNGGYYAGVRHLDDRVAQYDRYDEDIQALVNAALEELDILCLSDGGQKFSDRDGLTNKTPGQIADFLMREAIPNKTHYDEKEHIKNLQRVLDTFDHKRRLRLALRFVQRQNDIIKKLNAYRSSIELENLEDERRIMLRQIRNKIDQELGDGDHIAPRKNEINQLRDRVKAKQMPPEAEKAALREVGRLKNMHPTSAEYNVAHTYVDTLLDLPWNDFTEDNLDLRSAQRVLDKDHYGLEKVKERIIEYLAVRNLRENPRGPILCFVGPPGTGKTSITKGIAEALGRAYRRISLGGVRDEADIRGHRRTYIGALPGRIINGLIRTGSSNPVFVLDEIDKLCSDFKGDPSSALLEVLDPQQNFSFVDHYIDAPFDLSRVLFIATANVTHTIPPALLDRMEVIDLPGYTLEEKVRIANKFLIPRQVKANGLKSDNLTIHKKALKETIICYAKEAGLRKLEKRIGDICRQVAKAVVLGGNKGKNPKFTITKKNLSDYLGIPPYKRRSLVTDLRPGVVAGLSVNSLGEGNLLYIEACVSDGGSQTLEITGNLRKVMEESARTARGFIQRHKQELGLDKGFTFEKKWVHIHVPEGAVPKDGPSAGVAMLVALMSEITGRKVRQYLAMTGEITLRGDVLPVGGIKEKVMGARRNGVHTVILPKSNEKDLQEIPGDAREKIEFILVEKMTEVLEHALHPDE